jgi:hypothetical protein
MTTDPTDDMEERLEELEKGIQSTRKQAEADGLLPDPEHHKRTFADLDGDGEDDLPGGATG